MKTIEEYAVDLVADGAESFAEDDIDEGEDLAPELHETACRLAIRMAKAIENNPESFMAWYRIATGDYADYRGAS